MISVHYFRLRHRSTYIVLCKVRKGDKDASTVLRYEGMAISEFAPPILDFRPGFTRTKHQGDALFVQDLEGWHCRRKEICFMVEEGSVEISEDYGLRYHPITVLPYAAGISVDSCILIIYIVDVNEN